MRTWLQEQWMRLMHLLDDDPGNDLETEQRIASLVEALRAANNADRAWLAWRAQPNEATLAEVDQRMRELRGRLDAIRTPTDVAGRASIPAGGE
jgi:hypothetical protein